MWLSGPPGAGKSTTGALMGKDAGYVYFEADCTMNGQNPFVPLDSENPTSAAFKQKLLKASNNTLKSNWHYFVYAKCHLISKCPFDVLKSSNKPTNFFLEFLPLASKRDQIKKVE